MPRLLTTCNQLPPHRLHKACAKKQAAIEIPCRYCEREVARKDMDEHLKRCSKAKAARKRERREAEKSATRRYFMRSN